MRLLLTLFLFLRVTLSIAPFVPHAVSDAGDAGGDAG